MPTYRTLSIAVSALALALLPGCSSVSPAQACHVDVDATLPLPEFKANPLSSEYGMAAGAGLGAYQGMVFGPAFIVTALIGAAAGAACADAASRHPSAGSDFKNILATVNMSVLKQAMELEMAKPRAACQPAKEGEPASVLPRAVLKIEKIEAGMGCLLGEQKYWVMVHWRIVSASGADLLAASTETCSVTSFRNIDDWFADPFYARTEIEHLLSMAGRRIGELSPGPRERARCAYRSREDGEFE
jgi:hypothetical protein